MVAGLEGHRLGSCNIDMPLEVHAHIDGTPYQHARPLHEHELVHMGGWVPNQLTLITLMDMLYRRVGNAGLSSRTCLSIVVWPAWCMESGAVL